MRIPTFDALRAAAYESLIRFPFVLLAGAVAAVAGWDLVVSHPEFIWIRIFMSAQLGIALLFAIAIAAETHAWPRLFGYLAAVVAVGALAVYGYLLPEELGIVAITRHVQFTAGFHLLVAFIPFTAPGRLNGFWQYNRLLFLRFCLSALYSVVLYGGLAIALAAIDKLLGIEVDEIVYPRLWFFIAMLFNTWVFLGGVPRDILGLEDITDYTKALRVFAQYILVPLVIIYLVILTIYLGKIIITRQWPSGWIGYLVSSVAGVGILAHLLVHPMRDNADSQWVRSYSRWYYAAMIPAIVMLLLAIGKRIAQYGVTENRYLLAVLSGWLALVSLYFIFTRARNIKLIPITLCIVAFATSFGPWGAFGVSERSQMGRLTGLLEANNILADGMIRSAEGDVSFVDRKEISATLDYLVTTHGTDRLEPLFGDRWAAIDTMSKSLEDDPSQIRRRGNELVVAMLDEMGVEYVSKWEDPLIDSEDFRIRTEPDRHVYALDGADVFLWINNLEPETIEEPACTVSWDAGTQSFLIAHDGDTLAIDMGRWIGEMLPELSGPGGASAITWDQARVTAENDRVRAIVHVKTINGQMREGAVEISLIRAVCLLRWLD